MTAVDICFKYGLAPGELEAQALNSAREIYGIRKITFDEKEKIVRVDTMRRADRYCCRQYLAACWSGSARESSAGLSR